MSADDTSGNLAPRQHLAVVALLRGVALAEAAEQAGVSVRTLRRWVASESFSAAVRAEARSQAREATAHLLASQREAVDALRAGLRSGSPATRVRAARALLEIGLRAAADDTEERLSALEGRLEAWERDASAGSGWRPLSSA